MAALALTLFDETTDGKMLHKVELHLVSERTTLREVISQRIQQEVDEYNNQQQKVFQGLVQPTDTEVILNGYRLQKKRIISFSKQLEKALQAFESNDFFVLLDNKQLEDLNNPFTLDENSHISFIKLVPLVGG